MKYHSMKPRPRKKIKLHACNFQIHVNEKHLFGLILILIGVIFLQIF